MSQFSTRKGIFLTMLVTVTAVMLLYLTVPGAIALGGFAEAAVETLTVKVLRVGKADAIILTCGGETMVIDAGEEEDGEEVAENLKEMGIGTVDVLVITHYDKDHVGGAVTLTEEFDIGRVLVPDYTGDSAQYLAFMAALEAKGITAERLTEAVTLALGDAAVTVEPPEDYEPAENAEETDNDFSLVTTVVHGSMRLVFAGDIEKERITEYLASGSAADCDFLKVPHHGTWNAATDDLLEALMPEYAVICDSDKNPADEKTLLALEAVNAQTYETRNGDITVVSSGTDLEVIQ